MRSRPRRDRLVRAARRYVPAGLRARLVAWQRRFGLQWPRAGAVRFGDLRRTAPISPVFAFDRGQPVDRYYIAQFLDRCRQDIRGRALEFGATTYLDAFGDDRVRHKDVFSYVPDAGATIVGDLTGAEVLAPEMFDCIVCTQTVQMIYDVRLAVRRLHTMLKPGGVLLVTANGIVRTGRHLDTDGWGEYWHLTQQGARSLFADAFDGVAEVTGYGNVLSAVASLHGLASSELTADELDRADRDFDVIVAVRAVRRR